MLNSLNYIKEIAVTITAIITAISSTIISFLLIRKYTLENKKLMLEIRKLRKGG